MDVWFHDNTIRKDKKKASFICKIKQIRYNYNTYFSFFANMSNQWINSKKYGNERNTSIADFLRNSSKIGKNIAENVWKQLETDYVFHARKIQAYIAKKTGKEVTNCTFGDLEKMNKEDILADFKPIHLNTNNPKWFTMLDPQCAVSMTYTDQYTKKVHTFTWFPRVEDNGEWDDTWPLEQHLSLYTADGKLLCWFPIELKQSKKGLIYELDTQKYRLWKQENAQTAEQLTTQWVVLDALWDHMKELEYQWSHLSDTKIISQDNLLWAYANSIQSDPTKHVKPQLPLPDNQDPHDILNEWETIKKSNNKFDNNPFYGFHFAEASDIPTEVQQSIEHRGVKDPKWRVYQWAVYLNKTYFCSKYGFKNINRKRVEAGNKLIFTMHDWTERSVLSLYREEQYKICIQEMLATKIHEITHRLLHFHDIHTLQTQTTTGETITVDQEFLCEVADRMSRPRTKWGSRKQDDVVKTDNGKTIFCKQLEEAIARLIPWFTRNKIRAMDIHSLEEYLQQCEQFDTLAAANAAVMDEKDIKQYTKIRKKHLDDFINKQWPKLDLNNPDEKKRFDDALELQEKITDLQQKISSWASLTPDELTEAQATHQAVNNFFKPGQTQWNAAPSSSGPEPVNANQKQRTQFPPFVQPNDDEDDEQWEHISDDAPENIGHNEFTESFVKTLWKEWSESWVKCETGTVIFLKDTLSTIPWYGHNRVKYVITGIWDDTISLRMEDATENDVSWSKVFTLPKNQDTINTIAKIGKQSTLLFKKTQKNNFVKKIGDFAGWQRPTIGKDFTKSFNDEWKTTKWPITHVGSIKGKITWLDKTENVIYKVERWYNKVTVSWQVNKKDISKNDKQKKELRTKQMDYDTFMVFCKSKGLAPYNEKEVKRAWMSVDPAKIPASDISRKDKLVSLWAVWNFLKAIPESIKKKVEEEQEFQTALAKDYFANWIPNTSIGYLDEIRSEIGGMDALVWQKIQKYKSDRTGGGDKSDVHDVPIFEWMRDALFINPSNRRNFKYKAASWLLYALEKWSLYPRALAPYANQDWWWYWIKIILGDEMHAQFKKQRQNMIDQRRSEWINNKDNFYDRLVKYELEFIQQATTDKPFWWSKFWREIESHKDKLFGWADSIDPGWIAAKGNFDAMYEAFLWWWIKWNNPKTLFSALKAMEWAIETDNDLSLFYQCIVLIFVTGIIHTLPTDYRNKLAWIWRAKWIPIALFASNTYASGEVVRLIDHIAKNAWMRSFTDYIGSSAEDFDRKHVGNYAEVVWTNDKWDPITAQHAITDHFKERWASAWDSVINWFAPGENLLKTKPYPDWWDVPSKTKEVVSSYLGDGWIFNTYLWNQWKDYYEWVDAQTPIYQKNLMNLAKWPLKSVLWLSWKNLQINADETTQQMWKNFVQIIGWYDSTLKSIDAETIEPMMSFLYGKYLQLFGDKLNAHYNKNTYKKHLENALLEWWSAWEVSMQTVVKKWIIGEKTKQQQIQQQLMNPNYEEIVLRADIWLPIAQDWIQAFSELMMKWMEWLSKETKERIIKTGNKFAWIE